MAGKSNVPLTLFLCASNTTRGTIYGGSWTGTLTDWSEDMYAESNQPQSSYEYRPQHQIVRCANCDIEILWSPTVAQGKSYCCTGCAAGGPCNCDYSQYRSVTIAGIIHYTPEREAEQP